MNYPCLVIIDVQEKLFPAMYKKNTLLKNLKILIKGFQLFKLPIIITEQVPDKLGKTIIELSSLLDSFEPIPKSTFSCAGETEFMRILDRTNAKRIILAGIESHVCVYQTAYDLLKQKKNVEIVVDCISSRTLNNHTIAIDSMKKDGASLRTIEMLLFSFQKNASGDNFKKLIKLIK